MEMVINKGFFGKFLGLFTWVFNPSFWIKFMVIMCIISVVYTVWREQHETPERFDIPSVVDKEEVPVTFDGTEIVTFAEKIEAIIKSNLENFESAVSDVIDSEYDSVQSKPNKYGLVVVKGSNGCYTYRDGDGWIDSHCFSTYQESKTSMDSLIKYKLELEALKNVTWQEVKGE